MKRSKIDEGRYSAVFKELRHLIETGDRPQELAIRLGRAIDVIMGDLRRLKKTGRNHYRRKMKNREN